MSKQIVIATVYNSENCGSFLQAYAMQTVLQQAGWDVAFYKRKTAGTTHAFLRHLFATAKRVLLLNFQEIPFVWNPWFAFQKATKRFRICTDRATFYQEAETVLLGSDTVWNFDSAYFRKTAAIYLGTVFGSKRVVGYAVSAANTAPARFHETVSQYGGLGHISHLLVRDTHTKWLVEGEGRVAQQVTDPTLLLTKADYLPLADAETMDEPYLLLYHFDQIGGELQAQISHYAKRKNWKIVSLLHHREWCDRSIPADPHKMIGYFHRAGAVVTDTFHGCAFSMIFEKPFAVHDEGKQKVQDLLCQYGEDQRLFTQATDLEERLEHPCEVVQNGTLDRIREESLAHLYAAVNV